MQTATPKIFCIVFIVCLHALALPVFAQNKFDTLKDALAKESAPLQQAKLHNDLAMEIKTSNIPLALGYARQGLQIAQQFGFQSEEGMLRSTLGFLYSYTERLDSAVYWNQSAIQFLLPTRDSFEISRNYNRLGADYLLKGDYSSAVIHLVSASQWANTAKIKANALNNLGMINKKNGDYAQAVSYYIEALKQYELTNDPANRARTLSNLGSLYIQKKDYQKAEAAYEEAYDIAQQLNVADCIGQALNGLGIVTGRLGDKRKAIALFEQSAAVHKAGNYMSEYAQQLISIADLYSELGENQKAEKNYFEAEKILITRNDHLSLSAVYNNISDYYIKNHQPQTAISYLEKAYQLSKKYKDLNYNKLIVKNLSNLYEQLGDTKKALEYRKLYEKVNEKMVNVAEQVKYAELNQVYETSKKDKQIAVQTQKITELKTTNTAAYIVVVVLIIITLVVLILLRRRGLKQQRLELNILSISRQISSLKDENSSLKNKLRETEQELVNLASKQSAVKEPLPDNLVLLSKREYEVLLFIAEGLSDKDIAEKIFVSVNTVRTHVRRIYDKLLVSNRTEAVAVLHKYNVYREN